jgi:hypothetical protein
MSETFEYRSGGHNEGRGFLSVGQCPECGCDLTLSRADGYRCPHFDCGYHSKLRWNENRARRMMPDLMAEMNNIVDGGT